jgi:hypothetical protein
MRKFKMGLITLAASAAVLVPSGAAVANPSLFEIYDVASGNTVKVGDIDVLTGDCLLNGTQILALLSGNEANCNSQPGHKVRPHH